MKLFIAICCMYCTLPCFSNPFRLENEMHNDTVPQLLVQEGDAAPELKIPDLYGHTVSIADYKGKYLLIDFWASWCRPCRTENPFMVKLFNEFQSPDFDMLGISIDTDRAAWYNAVKADGLPWLNLCNMQGGTDSTLIFVGDNIDGRILPTVPQTYLIDPSGKVIAKNLRGEELAARLREVLKVKQQ